ncbi:MAG: [LysW]-lysine hydrolase [Phycisphaerales bacterium JB058]
MNEAEQVLFDLVATPSVSGSERKAAEVFVRHASELGYDAEIDEAGNALAHRGPIDAPVHIVLLGHIDTVPGDIPVRVESGVLHGRGSVDAKGPLAAMLVGASRAVLPEEVRVTVAGAVGEETAGSPGARHLAQQYRPSACVIGEPSGWDGVTLGYKGRLLVRATCTRSCAHTAGPLSSATDELHAWWGEVLGRVARFNMGRERAFDQVQANIRSWSSEDDGLHETAALSAGFRLPIGVLPEDLVRKMRILGEGRVRLQFEGMEVAIKSDRNDPVARAITLAIREAGGRPRPKLKTGTADFNVVGPIWQCPIAAYGPGDSSLDHTPEERLSLEEYARAVEVIRTAVEGLSEELLARSPAEAISTKL